MNLILDIGNTLAKVALIQDQETIFSKSYKELTLMDLDAILSRYSPQKAIASIVGKIRPELINLIQSRVTTIILDPNTPIPLKNQYSTPETLGYDRIAVAVGANSLYPSKNVLIIDAGTAITYDLVTSDSVYLGGAISPGISLRFSALNSHTAKLPLLEKTGNYPLIGQSTNECILSGVLNGVIAEIDAYIDNVKNTYPVETVLTGGDSNFLVDKLKNSIFVNQNLLTIGLNMILEFNLR